jgi:hypothetical protein
MPNHCSNKLVIKGDVSKFKKSCIRDNTDKDAWDKLTFDFNTIVPCPESIGYDLNWYKSEWGTKNSAYDLEMTVDAPDKLILYFFTAWTSVNENFVRIMSEKFPDLNFIWYYYEPNERFAGYFEACNGDVTDNDYSNDEKEYLDIARDEFEDEFEEEA